MNPFAYQPRRPVPWKGLDVALLIGFLLLPFLLSLVMHELSPASNVGTAKPASEKTAEPANETLENVHPLGRLLTESRSVWPLLLGIALAVVITPITEELFFRLLLQGWLESMERRLRRPLRLPRRLLGAAPIAIVAMLFAAVHRREPNPHLELTTIVQSLGVYAMWSLTNVAALICWLKFSTKATMADFGVDLRKLPGDVGLGFATAFWVLLPIFAARLTVLIVVPPFLQNPWADPIFLLPLAVALGFLYFRTHRIVPSIALHAAFNAVGVLMALMSGK
jgi:membrane protease YdiL (CAAX protease family)